MLIIGYTRDAIQRNILTELCNLIGIGIPKSKATECLILGRMCYFIGASDERSVSRIQGSTVALAYVDEATRIPPPFFRMLLSRLSITGAQLLVTCNPEGPAHWLKKDFLDRAEELKLKSWRFELDDNPSLDNDYKEALKKEYTGHWYARYILGEWAVASGLVYDCFDSDNIYDEPSNDPQYYIAGLDYGTINATACVLIGVYNTWPKLRIEDEYYYSSIQKGRQKTDSELAYDIKRFLGYRRVEALYADPSAASIKLELMRNDISVLDASNDVIPGIKTVHNLFGNKELVVSNKCKNLIEEIQSYSWDERAADRGVDAVKKLNDHMCFIAGTKIVTSTGEVNIEDVKVGDYVLTRRGFKPVVSTMRRFAKDLYRLVAEGRELIGTGDHPVKSTGDDIPLKSLNGYNEIFVVEAKACQSQNVSCGTASPIEDIQDQKTLATENTLRSQVGPVTFIEIYGNSIKAKFLGAIIFIMSTVTQVITRLKTCYASVSENIESFIHPKTQNVTENIWKTSGHLRRNGMLQRMEEIGIGNTDLSYGIKSKKEKQLPIVSNAGKATNITRFAHKVPFAPINVSQRGDEHLRWTISKKNAKCASNPFPLQNIRRQDFAEKDAPEGTIGVYNLEVEDVHEYVANGILVSNCDAMRYAIFTHMPDGETVDYSHYQSNEIRRRIYGDSQSLSEILGQGNHNFI